MTRHLLNWRYWALAALMTVTIVGAACDPDATGISYIRLFIGSKAVAVAAGWWMVRLHARWSDEGRVPLLTAED